jgi:centromere protein V
VTTHKGGCHCGKVRFEVDTAADVEATNCNCSICSMTGFLHLIVGKDDFRLQANEADITTYTFNTHTAKHMFCRHCGIKSFYIPRSHPDGVSVNVNCIDPGTIASISLTDFDGRNWEQNISKLSRLSD